MTDDTAYIGVDWGTHSSKWTWTRLAGPAAWPKHGPFKILRSEVCLEQDADRIFLSDSQQPPAHDSTFVHSIKRQLIQNPDAAFWTGPQRRMKLTLGELVAFSLWALVGEAYDNICRDDHKPANIEVRFSLPNWVDAESGAVARAHYEQAARVACYRFASHRSAWSRESRPTRRQWEKIVEEVLHTLSLSDDSPIDDDPRGFRSMLGRVSEVGQGVRFRFVAESSAAGLAGLRRTGEEDPGYLRKILVVDVGAGSTDIGYVLRSIPNDPNANEALCQLPPANTCEIAGDDLTRRIVEIYQSQGRVIATGEAEQIKVTGDDTKWLQYPAVNQWIENISAHVKHYVAGIPDRRWLPYKPGLQVLVTGGSGVVPRLKDSIKAAVEKGLRSRRTDSEVVDATEEMQLILRGPGARNANRLAVALGAASEELPMLSYFEKLDPPMPYARVRRAPSFVDGR